MQNYELLYIVSNQYTEDELTAIKQKVNAIIAKNGGVIGYEDFMGKKKLAYPIQKALHGYYQVAEFELEDTANLAVINNELKLDKEVVRAQMIAKPKITPAEIKRKKEREARGDQDEERTDHNDRDDRTDRRERSHRIERVERPVRIEKKVSESESKIKTKNLDEKIDEILKEDVI